MKLSIILRLSEKEKENQKTCSCLKSQLADWNDSVQVLIYPANKKQENYECNLNFPNLEVSVCELTGAEQVAVYQDATKRVAGDYVTFLYGGDKWSEYALQKVEKTARQYPDNAIIMMHKIMPDGKDGAFATELSSKKIAIQNLWKKFYCYPFYFGGTFLSVSCFKKHKFHEQLGIEAEREFFLALCADVMQVLYLDEACYYSSRTQEGDYTFFEDIYYKDWYEKSFSGFWIPFLAEKKEKEGQIPAFIQYHLLFTIRSRFLSNWNNRNKHVIPEGEERHCLELIGQALQYIDDDIMFNCYKLEECQVPDSVKWVYGILKYGEDFRFEKRYLSGIPYYGSCNTVFNKIANLRTNILFMNYEDGYLCIDGTVHPILYSMADDVYFMFNGKKFRLNYNGRYALTKVFGVSIYKNHSFHVELPMEKVKDTHLFCFANFGKESIKISFSYDSHFSRMSGAFQNSYWCFGKDQLYMAVKSEDGMRIRSIAAKEKRRQEHALSKEMFLSFSKRAWLFLAIRKVYFMMRPIMKRKPIWMYLDKIYKGGDSSEYLYRYAKKQKDGIQHYYLIDKNATDYKRLKKLGYKPLVRGSIKHRLVFLMADMMIISNSTVFAFNNFGLPNSSYIRDLVDFHVCCVQHGMSVQKIAVAQNRLRDNTRLYFCASKYEIENLSRPIYDYVGYDALKLTGVPRYDGLVNDDKKQIMISPTWRMQAAVPVRTSEGEQRDYNPLFKESTYFKVFNALINDPRLIAAAKKYGYRIKYVLHPIVSAQVDDFDKNDYVDVIPAVGDMSYERMFCESSLMVTDFSGIQFDFAYMRKPLVYLHHKDIPQHYEEGTFFYDTMAFGEIAHDNDELIDLLCEYMENGCQMKEEYVRRADDFFYYNDRNNCKRIYETMIAYQDSKILHKVKSGRHFDLKDVQTSSLDASERAQEIEQFEKTAQKNNIVIGKKTVADYYYDEPIQEKTVALVGLGKSVRGSMQYILNELNYSEKFEGFQVYVRTSEETDPVVQTYIQNKHWGRTQTVSESSRYMQILESVKYLITEVYFPEAWIKKEGQVYINIWHGTPLKKLGLAKNSNNIHKDGTTQRNFIEADYLLYPNVYTKKNMLASYKVAELMEGKVLNLGYPRTGGLLQAAQSDLSDLRAQLAPNGEKLYAYMPTWKDYLKVEQVVEESRELLDYLDENLRDDQILYVNLHHKVSDSLDYSVYKRIRQFPKTVDSYQLLALTDALITDYSSVFYDYLVLRRQIILYCADYELYRQKRGTYMDLMEFPFDKVRTKEEVLIALNHGKDYDDGGAYQTFCTYDSVDNAKKLCSLFTGTESMVDVEPIPKTGRKQVLIYSHECADTKDTSRLRNLVETYDPAMVQLYIGCEMGRVDEHKESAYPMLFDIPVIGTNENPHLSAAGKAALKMYKAKQMTFDEAIAILKYDYALAAKRMFGRAKFDLVMIYDVTEPGRILSLAMMQCTNKLLFVSDSMFQALHEGDEMLKEAVKFALPYVRGVFVSSDEQRFSLQQMFGSNLQIQLVESAEELKNLINLAVNK